ncbi:MAG: carboxypeptidase regulatory-like domain-containing protein, partial [Proteobacteria bacterium]
MMRHQKKTVLITLVVLVVAFWLIFIRGGASKESGAGPSNSKARERHAETDHAEVGADGMLALMDSYQHPIAIYGRVIDQFGDPVVDASVEIFVHSGYFTGKSARDALLITDNEGKFSISGLKGGNLGVSAMKDGYLRVPDLSSVSSSASLSYTGGGGTGDRHAKPSNPVVLELIKIGSIEPMTHVGKKRWKLPVDGTPRTIALDTEQGIGLHQIQFKFTSDWNRLPNDNEINSKNFNWSFEIRVPQGGFVWDESDVQFEAPESGYR